MSKSQPRPPQAWARHRGKITESLRTSLFFSPQCILPRMLKAKQTTIPSRLCPQHPPNYWAEEPTSEPASICAQEQRNTLCSPWTASPLWGPRVMLPLGTFTFANNLMAVSVHRKLHCASGGRAGEGGAVSGMGAAMGWRCTDLETCLWLLLHE